MSRQRVGSVGSAASAAAAGRSSRSRFITRLTSRTVALRRGRSTMTAVAPARTVPGVSTRRYQPVRPDDWTRSGRSTRPWTAASL
ncbi:Uncharacterised protein [Mycobacteroides abscessus]|nr:Uncharacterised protein [Mycobacteroides abscessus]